MASDHLSHSHEDSPTSEFKHPFAHHKKPNEIPPAVIAFFTSRRIPLPHRSELFQTGLIEYIETCEKERTTPLTKCALDLKRDRVDLSHMVLRDSGAVSVATALNHNSFVRELDVHDCGFEIRGSESFAKMLSVNSTITHVDLSQNYVGPAGSLLAASIHSNPTISCLILKNCRLGNKDAAAIAQVVSSHPTLLKLDLSENRLSDQCAAQIAEILHKNTTIVHLDISYNTFQPEGSKLIITGLRNSPCPAIETLNLSWNALGSDAGKMLGLALSDPKCKLKKLNVAQTKLDPSATVLIAQGMEKNTSLEEIDLKNNFIGDDGARAVFRALQTNRSVQKFDLRGCNMVPDGKTLFDEGNPTGHYKLNLSDLFDYQVALKLQELEKRDIGLNWLNVTYNYKPMHADPTLWKVPNEGILELDYKSGRRPPPNVRELDPEDFASIMSQLSDPHMNDFDRLSVVQMAAMVQYYSSEQVRCILSTFADPAPVREPMIQAFTTMFGRIVDRSNLIKIVQEPLFNKKEIIDVQKRLGDLVAFSPENPTGHYELNLSIDFERQFATMLYDMSATEEGGMSTFKGRSETNTKGVTFGVRNATLDGEQYLFDPRSELPESGVLVLDYVCGKDIDKEKIKEIDDAVIEKWKHEIEEKGHSDDVVKMVELTMNETCVKGEIAKKIMGLFHKAGDRIRVATKVFSRMVNRKEEMHKLFEGEDIQIQAVLGSKLGNANTFNPKFPYRHWVLDLSDPFDYDVAMKLAMLATVSTGFNWRNETIDGVPFRFSENNKSFRFPTQGVLEFDYVKGDECTSDMLMQRGPSAGGGGGRSLLSQRLSSANLKELIENERATLDSGGGRLSRTGSMLSMSSAGGGGDQPLQVTARTDPDSSFFLTAGGVGVGGAGGGMSGATTPRLSPRDTGGSSGKLLAATKSKLRSRSASPFNAGSGAKSGISSKNGKSKKMEGGDKLLSVVSQAVHAAKSKTKKSSAVPPSWAPTGRPAAPPRPSRSPSPPPPPQQQQHPLSRPPIPSSGSRPIARRDSIPTLSAAPFSSSSSIRETTSAPSSQPTSPSLPPHPPPSIVIGTPKSAAPSPNGSPPSLTPPLLSAREFRAPPSISLGLASIPKLSIQQPTPTHQVTKPPLVHHPTPPPQPQPQSARSRSNSEIRTMLSTAATQQKTGYTIPPLPLASSVNTPVATKRDPSPRTSITSKHAWLDDRQMAKEKEDIRDEWKRAVSDYRVDTTRERRSSIGSQMTDFVKTLKDRRMEREASVEGRSTSSASGMRKTASSASIDLFDL